MDSFSYQKSGVDTVEASRSVVRIGELVRKTFAFHAGVGRVLLDIGYFANVIDLGQGIGLAISTDGVGTKILIAQALDKYDTVGIDCVAMNANDLLCVGARPLALVDYIAVETANADFIGELMKGLYEGAVQAQVSIPGGEIAQVKELIHGSRSGRAFDLVATCVGVVPVDRILIGCAIQPGDLVVGIKSSGLHSNGYTLARRALLQEKKYSLAQSFGELGRSLGEELLEPTLIYVKPAMAMLDAGLDVKAMIHITGDGLLNLARVDSPTGFLIDALPEPPPIFSLIQSAGDVAAAEMYTVFNMGIGFCIIVNPRDADRVMQIAAEQGFASTVIGKTTHDPEKKVLLPQKRLVGKDATFQPQ